MTFETIRYEITDAIATITLNRPDVLNAVNAQMHEELRAALKSAAGKDSARALILTGEGRGFCAGQDLSDRDPDGGQVDFAESLDKNYNRLVRTLRGLEMPVISAVNGVAAGAGANLALCADFVIAARSADFVQAFIRIGLVPDCGGTYFLPRLIGRARAAALSMLGDKLPAETAAEWGMIWKCVDDDQVAAEARQPPDLLAKQPTKALSLIRRALDASFDNTLDVQLDLERDLQVVATRTDDFTEGVRAFVEKRPAEFKGH
ncbi:MAG: 2-(1,2-epoxy-1,2-dihydrophenyl)acetyl-CoA isomerase PaaG [Proteobacteria bacterium]|nr:2-(1,2-epoxy-1,2-dihydrophenyl)acetyl-CoA isomerase PaaG [Pseudomonadota bacterium]